MDDVVNVLGTICSHVAEEVVSFAARLTEYYLKSC